MNEFITIDINKNFLALDKKYSSFRNSEIVILSCPFERTTSYGKGTASGPAAILKASRYVEFFDEETEKELCFEKGIATLKPLSFNNLKNKIALDKILDTVRRLKENNKFVAVLGGEHSISAAPIEVHYRLYPDFSVLHFDAHSDLRKSYEGSVYSHACFAYRVAKFTNKITQVGIRAQCKEEYEFIKEKSINTFYAHQIRDAGFSDDLIDTIISTLDKNVYITFDVDYFDPSIMPSTGTPEPNGFYWFETMKFIRKVCQSRNVVGFDVVELAPRKGFPFPDFLTARLIYKILNYKYYSE